MSAPHPRDIDADADIARACNPRNILLISCCSYDGLRKEELVSIIDEHLQKNATSLSSNDAFKDYYDRASPSKRVSGASTTLASDGEAKPKRKRAPKVKEEPEA